MRSETRANLVFLAILLTLTLPGAVILFRNKLQPGARPIGAPDPVRRATPYMDPTPVAGPISRIVPPQTAQWVASLSRRYSPTSRPLPHTALMSEHRSLELIGDTRFSDTRTISLLCWDEALTSDLPHLAFSLSVSKPLQTLHSESLPLPPQIRKELQEAGWPRPPHDISIIQLSIPPSLTSGPIKLSVALPSDPLHPVDFVTLFTSPGAPSK